MRKTTYLILITTVLVSCIETSQQTTHGWELTFRNDRNGNTVFGNKDQLIEAVRKGYPIRVGWGTGPRPQRPGSVEHVVDANFLTITDEKEVFAQIQPIIGQAPRLAVDSIGISFRSGNNWIKMLGTNGFTESIMFHLKTDSVLAQGQRFQGTSWYVNYPPGWKEHPENRPLWDSQP